jgi:hypothetical protein
MIIILTYCLSWYSTRSYPGVIIELFICCLLGPTSSWVVLPTWSLIFSGPPVQATFQVSSLALEHVIKPGELRFLIGLPTDWQSTIGRLCSNQADSCFIFLFGFFLHWCHGVGDVFNTKRSSYGFNFCLVYTGISLVGSWAFFKKSFTSCSDWSWPPSFSTKW